MSDNTPTKNTNLFISSTIIVNQYPYCDLCTTVVLTTVIAERFHPYIHPSIPSILYHGTILIFHTGSRATCITIITITSIPWWCWNPVIGICRTSTTGSTISPTTTNRIEYPFLEEGGTITKNRITPSSPT